MAAGNGLARDASDAHFRGMKRGTDWIIEIPPSALAPLGAFIYMPRKGESLTFRVQGPVTREQQEDYDARRTAFLHAMGELAADLYLAGKLGCSEHNVVPLDVVVDTPNGTFAACSGCYRAGVYDDVIGVPRPR